MNPEDDPEARIRQLEQPLAETARVSELGSSQPPDGSAYQGYPPPGPVPPPPPMPPPYGSPYDSTYGSYGSYGYQSPFPGATPRSSSGNRLFWILAAVFVVVILAVVGGIVAYAGSHISRTLSTLTPTFPTISSEPTTIPPPSGTKTRTPTAGPSTSPAPPPGGNLSVSGLDENKTLVCNDSVVEISGMSNTVVIAGHCASLTVSGIENKVTVDAVDTIEASGINNQVTYHSGSPRVSKSGSGNVVQQG
ncbi:hypothetical protein B1987_16715 [Mycobacterium kansasii]|uniref:DUF3060 domain-containing protein n=1 Tax=Mycobacterium attenuatum TaxID=2341086 RepID=A0A498PP88_9MYCO|nr:DUF3060 domain-containing protein [Mycobacterium attenuatum]ORB85158.1 hypothetical protein B1987_16715 [Mycobacterium kansasii]VBA33335.1 hypothetical protein LAUMK136_00421 [Mycobacterium attenuatum]